MKNLDVNKLFEVNGGTFHTFAPLAPAISPLMRIGAKIGEIAFEYTHPNPLGKMVYTK